MSDSLANPISLFTVFRCFLKSVQSPESLDLLALIFRISRSSIRFLSSVVNHEELRVRTRIVLKGACLLTIDRNEHFHQCSHIK